MPKLVEKSAEIRCPSCKGNAVGTLERRILVSRAESVVLRKVKGKLVWEPEYTGETEDLPGDDQETVQRRGKDVWFCLDCANEWTLTKCVRCKLPRFSVHDHPYVKGDS